MDMDFIDSDKRDTWYDNLSNLAQSEFRNQDS